MSIQYTVLGFKLTTFRTWGAASHKHHIRAPAKNYESWIKNGQSDWGIDGGLLVNTLENAMASDLIFNDWHISF